MKKVYSISYTDKYNHFKKVWDDLGYTLKFATIEEAENYIKNKIDLNYVDITKPIKIMNGYEIIKEIYL